MDISKMSKSKNRKYSLSFKKREMSFQFSGSIFFKYQIININKNLIEYLYIYTEVVKL